MPITATIATAHPGVPTSPGPCPELRGSPAAPPGVGLGSAATASAGTATTRTQAVTSATARCTPGRSEDRIDRHPDEADCHGGGATREQRADDARRALAAG